MNFNILEDTFSSQLQIVLIPEPKFSPNIVASDPTKMFGYISKQIISNQETIDCIPSIYIDAEIGLVNTDINKLYMALELAYTSIYTQCTILKAEVVENDKTSAIILSVRSKLLI